MASSILEMVQGTLSEDVIKKLGESIGADEQRTSSAIGAALPTLLSALSRNASTPAGAQALVSALERDHDGSQLEDAEGLIGKLGSGSGEGILRHVLGGRQAKVEQGISKVSGLDVSAVSKVLAMAAPLVLGALGKARREQGLGVDELASLLGQERSRLQGLGGAAVDMLSKLVDGDGDADVGDILAKGKGALGKLFG